MLAAEAEQKKKEAEEHAEAERKRRLASIAAKEEADKKLLDEARAKARGRFSRIRVRRPPSELHPCHRVE